MMLKKRILLTGSTGFIGNELYKKLLGREVVILNRSEMPIRSGDKYYHYDMRSDTSVFDEVGTVIHCAGIAHSKDTQSMHEVNVQQTIELARASMDAGVSKFIFLSSIGVNGKSTFTPFDESSSCEPYDEYSRSKFEAELELKKLVAGSEMNLVIVRPPLVYGPDAKGSFNLLIKLCKSRIPLPFLLFNNKKSFIFVENLVSFLIACIDVKFSKTELFLISDMSDVSTSELIALIRNKLGRPVFLFPFPVTILKYLLSIIGKKDLVSKLEDPLQVDSRYAVKFTGWKPQITLSEGLERSISNR
jgi:nucleoside-diphosphate-sugar epimerase